MENSLFLGVPILKHIRVFASVGDELSVLIKILLPERKEFDFP